MKISELLGATIGLLIAVGFLVLVYKIFPIGVALAITGGCFAALSFLNKTDKTVHLVGSLGSWLYPIGIIFAFIKHGILWGLFAIALGFIAYRYAKR